MFMPTDKHCDTSSHDVKSGLLFLSQAAAFVANGGAFLGGAAAEIGGRLGGGGGGSVLVG